jgi:hypothetical protein
MKDSQTKRKIEDKHLSEAGAWTMLIINALNACLLNMSRVREPKESTSNTIRPYNQ